MTTSTVGKTCCKATYVLEAGAPLPPGCIPQLPRAKMHSEVDHTTGKPPVCRSSEAKGEDQCSKRGKGAAQHATVNSYLPLHTHTQP